MTALTSRHLDALAELERHEATLQTRRVQPYTWRQGAMHALAAHGLVEWAGGTVARPAWRVTAAGRARLAQYRSAA